MGFRWAAPSAPWGYAPAAWAPPANQPGAERDYLKSHADMLEKELDAVKKRLGELEQEAE
jgi:hypothetical protein